MSRWYVIFLTGLTILVVLAMVGAGALLHRTHPNLSVWSFVASIVVAAGSLKAILEVAKLANELQSAQLQMEKLALEIEELQGKKADRSAVIVKPTENEIRDYGVQALLKAIRPFIQHLRMIIRWPF